MTDKLLKYLKVFLLVCGAALAILLVVGLVLLLDWPRWVAIFLVLILLGTGIGFLFMRKILARRREQQFVSQVIAQDEAKIQTLTEKEKDEMKELQDRWKEAVEALRKSHLRKRGNPLYALPWYLVMGESGSGKTTSIGSAKLSSPFAELSRISGISGTRNCDWWFFEQAIILDTAGRYAIPVDEGKDKEEWQKFLSLLIKYRKKEPIHGLIVTVAADKILQATPEAMEEDGRNIRRRIDELMRVLGVKFPVYVLVTKCDLVQGMTKFCEQVPEKSLDQPMGAVNHDLSTDVTGFVDKAMAGLGERLRNLRILLVHKPEGKTVDPALLLFPEEFENLGNGLKRFMTAAFKENPYQETPILRGLYFSSGRQEGSPFSHFLSALGLIGEKDVLPGTNKGLFLHDFYARILPGDRLLFAPTKRALEWRTLTRNLGVTAWVVLMIAVCGLLSFSFVKNLRIVRGISHDFDKPVALRGEMLSDLMTMDRFKEGILTVEKKNSNWWIPRFGLHESDKVEEGLKIKYCRQFQEGFLTAFDRQVGDFANSVGPGASDEIVGQYIVHLSRRINLLKSRIEGVELAALRSQAQPPYISAGAQDVDLEVKKKFGNLYLYYLAWRQNTGDLKKEMGVLQAWLGKVVSARGRNLQWVTAWIDRQGGLPAVTLADFWGGQAVAGERFVPPSFTLKGRELSETIVTDLEAALGDASFFSSQKGEFAKWYRAGTFNAWQAFGTGFSKGAEHLRGAKEWQQMAVRMTGEQGPYQTLLLRMAEDFDPFADREDLPDWVQTLYEFQVAKAAGIKGVASKAAEGGKKLLSRIERRLGTGTSAGGSAQNLPGQAYQDYKAALAAIAPVAQSRNQAFQFATLVYTEDPATSKSPFYMAQAAGGKLRSAISGGRPSDEPVGRLVMGPVDFLWYYARMETSCSLQAQWEEKVLAEVQGATPVQASQILLGPDGSVMKFAKGPLAPFVGRALVKGYYSKDALGGSVPLEAPFLAFLGKGAAAAAAQAAAGGGGRAQNYPVTIRGLPTDTNPEARMKPQTTRLEMRCAEGSQTIVNQNYPVKKIFTWAPESCTDVIFQIEVGDVVLVKKYLGDQGFPEFLGDFRGGKKVFYPNEFPGEKAALDRYGIKYIRVNYQFTGDRPVVAMGGGGGGRGGGAIGGVPRNIGKCWAP